MAIRTFNIVVYSGKEGNVILPENTATSRFELGEVDGHKGYYEIRYEGAVLREYERNGYDDSDFYADVWTGETIRSIEYASTRGWTYGNSARVDATPEVLAAAAAFAARLNFDSLKLADEKQATNPAVKGRRVKVVKGRPANSKTKALIDYGTEGEVFWVGAQVNYNRYIRIPEYRVGVRTDDGQTFFTPAKNVEVLNPEQYRTPDEDLKVRAQRNAVGQMYGHNAAMMSHYNALGL